MRSITRSSTNNCFSVPTVTDSALSSPAMAGSTASVAARAARILELGSLMLFLQAESSLAVRRLPESYGNAGIDGQITGVLSLTRLHQTSAMNTLAFHPAQC